jgi:hypothetical protein
VEIIGGPSGAGPNAHQPNAGYSIGFPVGNTSLIQDKLTRTASFGRNAVMPTIGGLRD